jgi:hypothetical protein
MAERRQKRESKVSTELEHEESFVLEPTQVEVGSGYTVSVNYDENEKPVVDVKTYGEVDIAKLRREIERIFPDAHIRSLETKCSIKLVKKRKRIKKAKKK